MVARGAGAAGPVLLACRQWDPLGLARRLPSLGVGVWRCAPLLPWQVQCPVRVCAALAAGSGGSGRYLVLCLSRFPLPAPRVPRCVWRAVSSGCPLPSLAGTPFHAVCAFRVLGPVALLVVPVCPLRVCALALPRRPPPLLLGGEAGSDPRGHLGVTWGVYLCADKPPLADIIFSHPPDRTRCDSVIGLAIQAMSGHIQYRGTASGDLYIRISGINRVFLS